MAGGTLKASPVLFGGQQEIYQFQLTIMETE